MTINNFKAFACDPAANVVEQPDYEALPALLSGFFAGTANSADVNKVLRQGSLMAAGIAQAYCDQLAASLADDGNPLTIKAAILALINHQVALGGGGGGSGFNPVRKTANYTAVAKDEVCADTSGGTFTITLPAAPAFGDSVRVLGDFATTNLTVNGGGHDIIAGAAHAATFTLNQDNIGPTFFYDNVTGSGRWRVRP